MMTCTFIKCYAKISLSPCIRLLMSTQSTIIGFAKGSAICSGLVGADYFEVPEHLTLCAGLSCSSPHMPA